MEKFQSCPICTQVPEKEIYQCRGGHVICHLCIVKVNGLCPQCRLPFGQVRIRNRYFEELLDSQEFDCKFQERGCAIVCQRGDITKHMNSCLYNPDTVSVCEQLGLEDCKFRLGGISRSEVLSHFEQVHNRPFRPAQSLTHVFEGIAFMEMLGRKRKAGASRMANPSFLLCITSQDTSESSTLFLLFGKFKQSTGFLSFYCVKAWEAENHPGRQFNAIFSLIRDPSSSSASEPSTSSSLATNEYNPFPFCGSMKVGGIKDVQHLLKASTVNFPISMLETHRFGIGKDCIQAKISPITAAPSAPGILQSPVQGVIVGSSSSTPTVARVP